MQVDNTYCTVVVPTIHRKLKHKRREMNGCNNQKGVIDLRDTLPFPRIELTPGRFLLTLQASSVFSKVQEITPGEIYIKRLMGKCKVIRENVK